MAATAAQSLDDRIAAAVEHHRDQLTQLVRDAVDRELDALVAAELAARLNGATTTATDQPVKLCAVCGQEPRLPNRRVGRSCHAARQRERRERRVHAAADGDGERPRRGPDVGDVIA